MFPPFGSIGNPSQVSILDTLMRRLAVAISFLSPLALAPHILFYYDVTPKIVILFVGAAAALILAAFHLDSLRAFCGTREGKAFSAAAVGFLAITAISAAMAAHPALAWNGSNWRRFGVLTQAACLVTGLIEIRAPHRHVEWRGCNAAHPYALARR